jgi:glycosyltransferase involved in cell wall biosynthesis/O-antigen/teichoic acid export membrane protein
VISQRPFVTRNVLASLASVIGGEAGIRGSNFVAALFIARVYGGFVLGAYAALLAVVTICVMFADNGLQTFVITELSARPTGRNEIVGQAYICKTILLAAAALILAATATGLKVSPFLWMIGAWVTARTVLQSYSQLQMAILKALSKANVIWVVQALHSLFLLAGIWLAFWHVWTVFGLLAWFTAGQFGELVLTIVVLRWAELHPSWPAQLHFWALLRKSAPFGIAYGLANLIARTDTVVLSTLVPLSVLGTFSAANSILLIVYVAAWLLGSVLLPEMVRLSSSLQALKQYVGKWARLLALITIPSACLVYLAAPKMMLLLFGRPFYRSGALAAVMALACPFILLNSVYTSFAIAMTRRRVFTSLFVATAVAAIGLDLVFGRAFGSMGIAVAIVIRECALFVAFWVLMSRPLTVVEQPRNALASNGDRRAGQWMNLGKSVAAISKTVAIDARWLVGGIGTYTENLLFGLGQKANGLEFHAIVRGVDVDRVKEFCPRVTVLDVPIYSVLEQFLIPSAAGKCDLLHVPHFNVPLLHRGLLIVSIMDVIHLRSPDYRHNLSSFLYARPMLNAAARKADQVVTVSNYSKAQIMETLGTSASKISVIHCGVGAQFRENGNQQECQAAALRLGIRSPFLLYVGNLKPHKNVSTLLRAFAQLRRDKRITHSLVIVGEDARWKSSVVEECSRLGIRDSTIFVPYVSPALLPTLYAAADLLVMPSTAEGFGLPVLEAMACGTPVVCSNAASLPEVAGDAALYFDPASHEELAAQIERLLHSSDVRASLRSKGLRRARQFTWEESTRKHLELYCQVLGMNWDGVRGDEISGSLDLDLNSYSENRR